MKIAFYLYSINNHGGLDRIIIDKANAFADIPGMEVWIRCETGSESDVPAFPISSKVHRSYFNKPFAPKTSLAKNPFKYIIEWWRWRTEIRKEIQEFSERNSIDISISSTYNFNRPYSSGGTHHIYESHAYRKATERNYLPIPIIWQFLTPFMVRRHTVVALSRHDASFWQAAKRLEIIPNFTNIRPVADYKPDTGRVMAAGRLDYQKGFDILISAWQIVHKRLPNLQLDIFGPDPSNGKNRKALQQQIDMAGLSTCVHLCGITDDMPSTLSEHSAFVLSSRFEGFGLVLLEALTCGVPCVSFDCPAGPSEVITDKSDSILVPFDGLSDEDRAGKLAEAICRLMEIPDSERMKMSDAAIENSRRFSKDIIISRWVELFNSLLGKN